MNFVWSRLDQLSGSQWHEICANREAVFIVEQNCAYQDADEFDQHSWHLVARVEGCFAGYLRLVDPGRKHVEPSIGRVLNPHVFRRRGLGKLLMREAVAASERYFPGQNNRISAQRYLLKFYSQLGFKQVSDEYLEDGIPHIEMLLLSLLNQDDRKAAT